MGVSDRAPFFQTISMNFYPHLSLLRLVGTLLVLFSLVFATSRAAEKMEKGEGKADSAAFRKIISFKVWGESAEEAMNRIMEASDVDVRTSASFLTPEALRRTKVYLYAEQITVAQAVEWLAAALGCRYWLDGPRSVVLTTDYGWIDTTPLPLLENVETLMDPAGGIQELEENLWELVRVQSLLGDRYFLRIEEHPPEIKVVAVLPKPLRQRLYDAFLLMERPGEDVRSLPSSLPSATAEEAGLLDILRSPVIVRHRNRPLLSVIEDLSLQAGINIALDHHGLFERSLPLVTLELGEVTTRRALEELARQLGLGGIELDPPNGVRLTQTPSSWRCAASRKMLWEEMVMKSYAAQEVAARFESGRELVRHLQATVAPEIWLDPVTALLYHARSGNLIAVAPPDVQAQLGKALLSLLQKPLRQVR